MKLDELVTELRQYLGALNVKHMADLDGDQISRLAVKLASLNSTLGTYVAQAERDADQAEMVYELAREKVYTEARKAGKSGMDAESLKRTQAIKEREHWLKLKHNHRVLSLMRRDVQSLVDSLRSRLGWLKAEAHDL
jgi:hypothetical protein